LTTQPGQGREALSTSVWSQFSPGIDVIIFKIFFAKKFAKNGVLYLNYRYVVFFYKYLIITLVFEKSVIFCRKLAKIAENCDHSIDPSNLTLTYFLGSNRNLDHNGSFENGRK
jgi:hypothetical protein